MFMMKGKVRAALRILSDSNGSGILPLDKVVDKDTLETVRDVLLKKHPPKQPPRLSSLIEPDSPPPEPHPVMFEVIDGKLIRSTVLKMDGAAGPSGLDATAWKRMCTSLGWRQLIFVNHLQVWLDGSAQNNMSTQMGYLLLSLAGDSTR